MVQRVSSDPEALREATGGLQAWGLLTSRGPMGESGGAPDGKGKSRLTSKRRFSCGGASDKRSFERLHKGENSVEVF